MTSATRTRITWSDLPPAVRARVEEILGAQVIEAVSQPGGYSPGTADRVRLSDGRRAFVKAVTPEINATSAEFARRETRITAALPPGAPVPRVLGAFDDGDWVVLVLEDIDGRQPRTPWVESEIDAAVTALRDLAAAVTPPPLDVPRATVEFAGIYAGWDNIAADPPHDLDPWAATNLPALRASAAEALAALETGDTLAHADIRADNLLVRGDGSVVIVDWPWACAGPDWIDRLLLGMNVLFAGGDADRVIRDLDPAIVTAAVTGFVGYFLDVARQPPPPGIPTVRAFQRAQGDVLLSWVKGRQ